MDRIELKLAAKARVQGHRWTLLKANIVVGVIAYGANMILSNIFPLIFGGTALISQEPGVLVTSFITTYIMTLLISTAVSAPLQMGIVMYYNQFDEEDFADINIIFHPYKYFVKVFVITIFINVLVGVGTLFLIVPGIILSFAFAIIPYVYMKHPELGVMDMVSTAWRMMRGHKMDYFILSLSFLGWILLGVATCGVLLIWLIPYQTMTYVRFFNEIDKEYFKDEYQSEEIIETEVEVEENNNEE